MTDFELINLKSLYLKAMPGPWEVCGLFIRSTVNGVSYIVAELPANDHHRPANAELITLAHNILPEILTELEAVKAERDELETELKKKKKKLAKIIKITQGWHDD
jgi:hypothetical protein